MPSLGLLCVHPHPDDESIACGGVLARYADEGARVAVVTATRGEEGEVHSSIDLGDVPLGDVRAGELVDSLAVLGVDPPEFLGYRDSGMAGTAANDHPDSYHVADLDAAAMRLAGILRRFRPDVMVSDDEKGTYGHPDHVKSHAVARRAFDLAADPAVALDGDPWLVPKWYAFAIPKSQVWELHQHLVGEAVASPFGEQPVHVGPSSMVFGVPDELITASIDVRPWLERKRAAMAAHRTQIGPESFFLNLPEELATTVFGWEHFVRLRGAGPDREDDLFAGLR